MFLYIIKKTPAQFSMEVFNLPKYEAYFPEHLESCCKECQNVSFIER